MPLKSRFSGRIKLIPESQEFSSRGPNATEDIVTRYVEEFHKTLADLSSRFFSAEQSKQLLHNSLLPATITCYVSTQFGIGFEYSPAADTKIVATSGSARVEDLFVRAPPHLRRIATFFSLASPNNAISRINIEGAFPFRLSREDASINFSDVRFSYAPLHWQRDVVYAEIYGDRRASRWSIEAAQNRAKDEVLSALLVARRAQSVNKTPDEYISSLREKIVLVLGAYDSAGEERLLSIKACLKELGYDPILMKDIPDFEHYDLSQKFVAISALSRFVIFDDSIASGHLNEFELCRMNRWVTVLLRAGGIGSSWMTAAASATSNVILEAAYNPENPRPAVEEATRWAEDRLLNLKKTYNTTYPWRKRG